jgi:LuxR family maltose regulon positive regulatory protein
MATHERLASAMPAPGVLSGVFNAISYYFGLGYVLRERNELDAAETSLAQGLALVRGAVTAYPHVVTLGYLTWARLQLARGDVSTAFNALDELDELAGRLHYFPRLARQAAAMRAHLWLATGDLAAAGRWAEASRLTPDDAELPYEREQEYAALARVLIAQRRVAEANRLLGRLLGRAEAGARMGNVIELLVLQALAHQAGGDKTNALAALHRALALAEPEGYVRVFVDEGEPMRLLMANLRTPTAGILRSDPGSRMHTASREDAARLGDYITQLLAVFGEPTTVSSPPSTIPRRGTQAVPHPQSPLVEPLSDRELEVLRLLAAGKSNQAIADALILAVGTVKKHLNNIFGKLGVESRTQCIVRARQLQLIE